MDAVFARVVGRHGRLDGLVNNAALTGGRRPRVSRRPGSWIRLDWRRALDVNLDGTFPARRAAAAIMREARRGSIVNISSVHAQSPNP